MRVLFIGGTGFISAAVSRQAISKGFDLYLLNRGSQSHPAGSHRLTADIHKPEDLLVALQDLEFDVVVDWIAYAPDDIDRDVALFRGPNQTVCLHRLGLGVSKASSPLSDYRVDAVKQPILGVRPRQDCLRRTSDASIS